MNVDKINSLLESFAGLSKEEQRVVKERITKRVTKDSVDKYYLPKGIKEILGRKEEKFLGLFDMSTLWLADYESLLNDNNVSAGRRAAKALIEFKSEIPSLRKNIYALIGQIKAKRQIESQGKPKKQEPAAFKAAREANQAKRAAAKAAKSK